MLEAIIEAIQQSAKYNRLCEAIIRHVAEKEAPKYHKPKAAIKAVKNKLHQIGGAYLNERMAYAEWLMSLQAAHHNPDTLQAACSHIMAHHASTRERLPILDDFYSTIFAHLPPSIQRVRDLACGLNPLALPWMPTGLTYEAYDIYTDMMDFHRNFMTLIGVNGTSTAVDVTQFIPTTRADVALILKTIPCLEQLDKHASLALLENVNADWLVVSFPVRSLGGRSKGMVENYEAHLYSLIADKGWPLQRLVFDAELVFILDTRSIIEGEEG